MRVVFDTNILVSALIFPGGRAELAVQRIIDGSDLLLISKPIVDELLTVLARKFSRDREQLARLALAINELVVWVQPSKTLAVLVDEPDNRILECAVAGRADKIVTGDKELLHLGSFDGISIVSLREYLSSKA
jgi:putative PIN family toxin of toxin-antitoxin system